MRVLKLIATMAGVWALGLVVLGLIVLGLYAAPDRINNDLYVAGNLSAQSLTLPASSVSDSNIQSGANVAYTKMQHLQNHAYSQPGGSTTVAERKVVYVCKVAGGVLQTFDVGAITAGTGTSTTTFDLQKNGTTVLTGTISLDATTAAYILKSGTISGTVTFSAGDVLEVVVTSPTAGTGAVCKGGFGIVSLYEKGQ